MTRKDQKVTSDHLQPIITKTVGGEQRCHAQKGIGRIIMHEMDASFRARHFSLVVKSLKFQWLSWRDFGARALRKSECVPHLRGRFIGWTLISKRLWSSGADELRLFGWRAGHGIHLRDGFRHAGGISLCNTRRLPEAASGDQDFNGCAAQPHGQWRGACLALGL